MWAFLHFAEQHSTVQYYRGYIVDVILTFYIIEYSFAQQVHFPQIVEVTTR